MAFSMLSRSLLRASGAPIARSSAPPAATPTPSLLFRLFSISSSLAQSDNPPSNTLFIGGLNFDTDSDALARHLEDYADKTVKGSRVIQDRLTGRSKGFGYVEFDSERDATEVYNRLQSAKGQDELLVDGFKIRVDYATSYTQRAPRTFGGREDRSESSSGRSMFGGSSGDRASRQFPPNDPSPQLFLGNVPHDVSKDQISEYLSVLFPDIQHADLRVSERGTGNDGEPRDPTLPEGAQHRGFAFLEFSSVEDATTVLEGLKARLRDQSSEPPLGSYSLRVDFRAPQREKREGGGGGRGGFGGGRGGGNSYGGRSGDRNGFSGGRGGFRGGYGGDRTRKDFNGNTKGRWSRDGGSSRYSEEW